MYYNVEDNVEDMIICNTTGQTTHNVEHVL